MDLSNSKIKEIAIEHFPSTRLVISLYVFGALISLVLGFLVSKTPQNTANCLTVAWALALGALAMSVAEEAGNEEEEDF